MVKRCDSVDALMYAYYEMMRIKEENRMLKKNENYVEFTLQYTSVDWAVRSKDYPEVCLKGYSDFSFPGVPIMDVVCNEFDHKVVVVSKRDFEKLQTENEQLKQKLHEFDPMPDYKELLKELYSTDDVEKLEWTLNHICGGRASANGWIAVSLFWKQNYETLSKLVGFSSVEEIQDYLINEAEADTLREAISKLKDQVKYTCDEWYSANSNNNSWKIAAECNSPKELIEKLNLLRDDISGRSTVIESYKRDIKNWQEATGRLSPEDISTDSLISKCTTLEQEVKILNGALQEWKEGTGCPSPSAAKTLIESGASWMSAYHSSCEVIKTWKKLTGCPTPIAAKTLIESGMSYEHGYHEVQEENRKLTEEIDSWKNVTGYSTPEDYIAAKIHTVYVKLEPSNVTWRDATGCDSPLEAKTLIESMKAALRESNRVMLKELKNNIDEWQKATGCETPGKARSTIADMMNGNETTIYLGDTHNVIARWQKVTGFNEPKDFLKWKANIEGILEAWKSGTGCKYPAEARILLEKWKTMTKCETPEAAATWITSYEKACERGNELAEGSAEREKEWQDATGRISPEAAKQYIDRLTGRLNKIHGYSLDW